MTGSRAQTPIRPNVPTRDCPPLPPQPRRARRDRVRDWRRRRGRVPRPVRIGADRGSATVWGLVVATALVAVFGGVLLLGQAVVARHRAASAADLAALAAAARWAHGPEAACATAIRVAGAQGATVTACTLRGEVAEISARAPAGSFAPTISARAGPPLPPSE